MIQKYWDEDYDKIPPSDMLKIKAKITLKRLQLCESIYDPRTNDFETLREMREVMSTFSGRNWYKNYLLKLAEGSMWEDYHDKGLTRLLMREKNPVAILNAIGLIAIQKELQKKIKVIQEFENDSQRAFYFRDCDKFDLFYGLQEEEIILKSKLTPEQNYIKELKRYPNDMLMKKYVNWIRRNSQEKPIRAMSYSNPLEYGKILDYRPGQAYEIISKLEGPFYIPGDGLGYYSMAAIFLNKSYESTEPNEVGKEARELGIITNDEPLKLLPEHKNKVVILSNLSTVVNLKSAIQYYERVVVIDEGRLFEGCDLMRKVESSGRVWVKGIKLEKLTQFSQDSSPEYTDILKKMHQPLQAMDGRAWIYLQQRKDQLQVTDDYSLELKEGNYPVYYTDDRKARVGFVIKVGQVLQNFSDRAYGKQGQLIRFQEGMAMWQSQPFILANEKMFRVVEFQPYKGSRIVDVKCCPESRYLPVSLKFNPRMVESLRYIDLDGKQRVVPVVMLNSHFNSLTRCYDTLFRLSKMYEEPFS